MSCEETSDITGIILAGGRSSRIGTNKALLKFGDQTILERVFSQLSNVVDRIILISNDQRAYQTFRVPGFSDVYTNCGPLGGLHSGLTHSPSMWNLVLSCDIPLIRSDFLDKMVSFLREGRYDMVLPQTSDGTYHPLCAVYAKTCLPVVEQNLKQGKFKMGLLYSDPRLRVRIVTQSDFPFSDALLTNVNTREEYLALMKGVSPND